MIVLAVQHQVQDYDAWKKVFDEFPPKAGGALFHRVNRGVDDPNSVVVVSGFASAEAARGFTSNPDLPKKMEEAGVIGAPRIELYEEVEVVEG